MALSTLKLSEAIELCQRLGIEVNRGTGMFGDVKRQDYITALRKYLPRSGRKVCSARKGVLPRYDKRELVELAVERGLYPSKYAANKESMDTLCTKLSIRSYDSVMNLPANYLHGAFMTGHGTIKSSGVSAYVSPPAPVIVPAPMGSNRIYHKVVNFSSRCTRDDFKLRMSNFYPGVIEVNGNRYESGEHAFHAHKYLHVMRGHTDMQRASELNDYAETFIKPSNYLDAREAKTAGGKRGMELTPAELRKWNDDAVREVQMAICRAKLAADRVLREQLRMSDPHDYLVHITRGPPDRNSGRLKPEYRNETRIRASMIEGGNILGKCWMALRDELQRG